MIASNIFYGLINYFIPFWFDLGVIGDYIYKMFSTIVHMMCFPSVCEFIPFL